MTMTQRTKGTGNPVDCPGLTAQGSAGSRLGRLFSRLRQEGRVGVMPFLTCGYPNLDTAMQLISAMEQAGADALELGVPFSDPVADGVTIQRASQAALKNGVTLATCLETVEEARRNGARLPILLMGYYNVFLAYGVERLSSALVRVGADGLIVPDLPLEESRNLSESLGKHGLDLISFVAPTSTDARIREVAARASGFIYCVSVTGVTGARASLSEELPELLRRVRAVTDIPLVAGFGISRPEHVDRLRGLADAAIVASALIDLIDNADESRRVAAAQEFVRALKS